MSDDIYLVDPGTRTAAAHRPVSFSSVGIRERSDLQEWILGHPEILGEPLLIVTSEFAGFDRSNRRLDLLAIDPDGNLVVIELKLELSGTFADLQALRYAAFCATMTAEQVVDELARFRRISEEDARAELAAFLGADQDELPEPSDRPRILLVAGAMGDPEVISTVLWLRNFDIDVRCLEVTPYQLKTGQIILVPRLIVPLPEAEEYQVRIERKESVKAKKERAPSPYTALWTAISVEFDRRDTLFPIRARPRKSYLKVSTGMPDCHYEWQVRKTDQTFHVAVHFESSDAAVNRQRLDLIQQRASEIAADIERPFEASEWGKKWAFGAFAIPLQEVLDDPATHAAEAAKLMDTLMQRTWPLLKEDGPFGHRDFG